MQKCDCCSFQVGSVGGGQVFIGSVLTRKRRACDFQQTDADVTSFDGGYGSAYLAKMVGQKRAREIFFWEITISPRKAYEWEW